MHRMFERFHDSHAARHAARHGGRHHGFFGFGGGGFGNDFPDMGGGRFQFGPGRKLGSGDLQLLLLALLADEPRHGYQLIKAVEEKSKGYYSPSPGVVYPALTYLEEIGHASVQLDGTKKRYHITDDGFAHLEAQRAAVDALLQQLSWIGGRMDRMRQTLSGGDGDDEGLDMPSRGRGRHGRHGHATSELKMARHALKAAMVEKMRSGRDQQLRIAEILEKAAAEIRDL